MSSMTLLIVYFVTANYDTLDGIWPTLFIVWKEPPYRYCKFLTRYNSYKCTSDRDSYSGRIRPREPLQIMGTGRAVFEVWSISIVFLKECTSIIGL
jgi:hypothetical protein